MVLGAAEPSSTPSGWCSLVPRCSVQVSRGDPRVNAYQPAPRGWASLYKSKQGESSFMLRPSALTGGRGQVAQVGWMRRNPC